MKDGKLGVTRMRRACGGRSSVRFKAFLTQFLPLGDFRQADILALRKSAPPQLSTRLFTLVCLSAIAVLPSQSNGELMPLPFPPDTNEPVPLPFRLSAFVPTNLVIVAGMLMPNPTLKSVIFWQWANQSLNGASSFSSPFRRLRLCAYRERRR